MKHLDQPDTAEPYTVGYDSLSQFRIATLDYLEGVTETMPSVDDLSEPDKVRARRWLESLRDARKFGVQP